ncbi:hypothetical protein TURU_103886 [Turdus rufiventris]|nr:hypothetical protein TURU_103886 [Turdus rufiventris]
MSNKANASWLQTRPTADQGQTHRGGGGAFGKTQFRRGGKITTQQQLQPDERGVRICEKKPTLLIPNIDYAFAKGREGRALEKLSGDEYAALVYMAEHNAPEDMSLQCRGECVMNKMQMLCEGKTVQQHNGTTPVQRIREEEIEDPFKLLECKA